MISGLNKKLIKFEMAKLIKSLHPWMGEGIHCEHLLVPLAFEHGCQKYVILIVFAT